jgi:hypothetical protein
MPTKKKVVKVLHTDKELAALQGDLAENESASNYYRRLRGLPPLERGPGQGAQNTKNRRWKQKRNCRWDANTETNNDSTGIE